MSTAVLRERASMLIEQDRAMRERSVQDSAVVSGIKPGTAMYDVMTGGFGLQGAGMPVNERTAMCVSAVFACVALIGGALGSLPFHIYSRRPDGRDRVDDDLWWMFNESPWPNWTAASAWSWAAQSIGLKGDGYWRIHRPSNGSQRISGFEPLHPDCVGVAEEKDPYGSNVYLVVTEKGRLETVVASDMLHFAGPGFDGKKSNTPLQHALRNPVGIALAADEYAGAFFRNGARADFALHTDSSKLNQDDVDILRNTWASRHQGPSNAHLPAVLTGGLKVQQLTMTSEDAQLLDTRRFEVEDVARVFGVPPHMIGATEKSTTWGTGVEQMSIAFVRYTMRRYIDSIQQEINRKVWPRERRRFGEFNADALMDGDSKAQAEYFAKALGGPGSQGWMAVNEVRRLKNLPPIDGGDRLVFSGAPGTEPTENDT